LLFSFFNHNLLPITVYSYRLPWHDRTESTPGVSTQWGREAKGSRLKKQGIEINIKMFQSLGLVHRFGRLNSFLLIKEKWLQR